MYNIFFRCAILAALFSICLSVFQSEDEEMPLPWKRELELSSPPMTGNDVLIACTLLSRDDAVVIDASSCDTTFDAADNDAVGAFQTAQGIKVTGIFDATTANALLVAHSADGFKDSGFTADSMGYKYKIHVPVYQIRSIETTATLFDAFNKVLLSFTVRAHGWRDDGTQAAWPDYGVDDYGLNEFTPNGNTPTGLVEIDLNSPEPDPQVYGPWPVNRVVRGLEGNAALMLPNLRDGILFHTGNWTTTTEGTWTPLSPMPDSSGCIHGHPSEIERVQDILVNLGVKINENTYSGKNYPYKPQGIAVIELLD